MMPEKSAGVKREGVGARERVEGEEEGGCPEVRYRTAAYGVG